MFGRIIKSFEQIKDLFGQSVNHSNEFVISKTRERERRERFVNVGMSGLSVQCIRTHFCDSNIYTNCVAIQ